jgi:hypothetical protein
MKTLYKLSLSVLLVSITVAQAHMCDHLDELRAATLKQEKLNQEAALLKIKKQKEEDKASQPKPKTWFSKENGKNALGRARNGTIAATFSYGLFMALTKSAPHLLSTKINFLMPYMMGCIENPQNRYSALQAAALGLTYTAIATLPTKTNMIIFGSLLSLCVGGAALNEKVKRKLLPFSGSTT